MGEKKFRLDNSGIMYKMVMTAKAQSLFRLEAKLSQSVNSSVLKQATELAFSRHKHFKTQIKSGFFRPYLVENNMPFPIEKDNGKVLDIIDFKKNNRYPLRITYSENRIICDFFHGICDGTSGMEFLKTVLFHYGELCGLPLKNTGICTVYDAPNPEENEDAFEKYYQKPHFRSGINSMAGGKAYGIRGQIIDGVGFGVTRGYVNTDALLRLARSHNCSVTTYLTALMIYSIYKVYIKDTVSHNLTAFVPINLRKFFPSKTMGNFTAFAKIVLPASTKCEFSTIVKEVKNLLSEQMSKEELVLKTGFTSLMSKVLFFKLMPLFLKSFFALAGRNLSPSKQTFILSNLGIVDLGENSLVEEFSFNLNCNRKTPENLALVSYNGQTVISFTRKILSPVAENFFFSTLNEHIAVKVLSNKRESGDILQVQ